MTFSFGFPDQPCFVCHKDAVVADSLPVTDEDGKAVGIRHTWCGEGKKAEGVAVRGSAAAPSVLAPEPLRKELTAIYTRLVRAGYPIEAERSKAGLDIPGNCTTAEAVRWSALLQRAESELDKAEELARLNRIAP